MKYLLLMSLFALAGCSSHQALLFEQSDAHALQSASEFHVKPVKIDVSVDPRWEIEKSDWDQKLREWSSAYMEELVKSKGRRCYELAPGTASSSGAIIELQVLDLEIGHHSLFSYAPAKLFGMLTITDAKSGRLIYRAKAKGETTGAGYEAYTTGGRVKFALLDVARAVLTEVGNEKP